MQDKIWNEIESQLPAISKFFERKDLERFSNELGKKWLSIRERTSSILENVTLNHSQYYADKKIIEAIAEFIANGNIESLPSEKNEMKLPKKKKKPQKIRYFKFENQKTTLPHSVVQLTVQNGSVSLNRHDEVPPATDGLQRCLNDLLNNFNWLNDKTAITTGFITNELYQYFLNDKGSFRPEHWYTDLFGEKEHELPVTGIRPYEADIFCDWLSAKFKPKNIFRVPTPKEASQIKVMDRNMCCWSKKEKGGWQMTGRKSPKRSYATLLKHSQGSQIPFPKGGFNHLSVRDIKTLNINRHPIEPLLTELLSRAIFNRKPPPDLWGLPKGLAVLGELIQGMVNGDIYIHNALKVASGCLKGFTDELAKSSFEPSAAAYSKWRQYIEDGEKDKASLLLETLSGSDEAQIAHSAHVIMDLVQASDSGDNGHAYYYLQRATARLLEYTYAALKFFESARKSGLGTRQYLYEKYIARFFKNRDTDNDYYEALWQYYWWYRLAMERCEKKVIAIEGIRVVFTGSKESFEKITTAGQSHPVTAT